MTGTRYYFKILLTCGIFIISGVHSSSRCVAKYYNPCGSVHLSWDAQTWYIITCSENKCYSTTMMDGEEVFFGDNCACEISKWRAFGSAPYECECYAWEPCNPSDTREIELMKRIIQQDILFPPDVRMCTRDSQAFSFVNPPWYSPFMVIF
jgi:hypothetical protein